MRAKHFLIILTITESMAIFGASIMHLSPLVAQDAVHSKAVVLLLLIYCVMYLSLFVGVRCWSLFWYALLHQFETVFKKSVFFI